MKERISERINANIDVKLICCNKSCSGITKNLSEYNMYVELKACSEMHSELKVLIHSIKGSFTVPVKISRVLERENNHMCIALELMEKSKKYLNLVNELKSASSN
jgi:hypothetical protein